MFDLDKASKAVSQEGVMGKTKVEVDGPSIELCLEDIRCWGGYVRFAFCGLNALRAEMVDLLLDCSVDVASFAAIGCFMLKDFKVARDTAADSSKW